MWIYHSARKKGINAMDDVNYNEKNAAFSVPTPASDLDLSMNTFL